MDDKGEPNRSFGSSVSPVFVLWGEREHATPAGAGSRDIEFSLEVNSSLGHWCGGDNNVTDPYVVGGELVSLWLGWFPVSSVWVLRCHLCGDWGLIGTG